ADPGPCALPSPTPSPPTSPPPPYTTLFRSRVECRLDARPHPRPVPGRHAQGHPPDADFQPEGGGGPEAVATTAFRLKISVWRMADRKSTRLNSVTVRSRMPSSA